MREPVARSKSYWVCLYKYGRIDTAAMYVLLSNAFTPVIRNYGGVAATEFVRKNFSVTKEDRD
ncbi:MAG: hypothetical protein J6Q59_02595 [Paludibacteraceae bacterium]|nr:hypothetical protein [Paludibacteraceae bacterium]